MKLALLALVAVMLVGCWSLINTALVSFGGYLGLVSQLTHVLP